MEQEPQQLPIRVVKVREDRRQEYPESELPRYFPPMAGQGVPLQVVEADEDYWITLGPPPYDYTKAAGRVLKADVEVLEWIIPACMGAFALASSLLEKLEQHGLELSPFKSAVIETLCEEEVVRHHEYQLTLDELQMQVFDRAPEFFAKLYKMKEEERKVRLRYWWRNGDVGGKDEDTKQAAFDVIAAIQKVVFL